MFQPARQYVGIAATTTATEVKELQEVLAALDWPMSTWFMNGPLVSRRTLFGEPASNPAQYRSINEVSSLMPDDTRFFNTVHFNSRDPQLSAQLSAIMRWAPQTQGVQLNIEWPDPSELKDFLKNHRHVYLILQVSRFAYAAAGHSPSALVERLKSYEGLVDYVLFDPSGGEGIPFDRQQALWVLEAQVASELQFGWGVTGGLDASRVHHLAELLEVYPWLSWDAQSRMRSRDGRDTLVIESCLEFLEASANLIRSHQ